MNLRGSTGFWEIIEKENSGHLTSALAVVFDFSNERTCSYPLMAAPGSPNAR